MRKGGGCFEQIFRYHLVSPVKEADAIFSEEALRILRCMSMTSLESSLQGLSAADALAKMIPSELREQLANAAAADHDLEKVDPAIVRKDMAVSSFSSALLRWVGLAGIPALATKLSLNESPWPSDDMEKAVKAFCHVCQAAGLACLLTVKFASGADGLVVNSEVEGQDATVVTMGASRLFLELSLHLESWPVIRDIFKGAPSHANACLPVEALDTIINFLVRFAGHCKTCIYEKLNDILTGQIKSLNALVPAWSHLVSNKKYNSAMAVKQLLVPTMQAKLEDSLHKTFHMTSSISRLYSEWGDDNMLEDHATIQEAEAALEHTRTTMTIIACVGLLEMKASISASDRAAKAAKLIKSKCVPDALRAKLKELTATT